MNRRARASIPHNFHKYLKPGALARIRDSRISARSHRFNSLSQIPIHHPPSDSQDPPVNVVDAGFPCFVSRIYGPRCPQRKKLMAANSILFLPVNPSPDAPDLVVDSFASDLLLAN